MCILNKNDITLGHLLVLFGYGRSHLNRQLHTNDENITQIELFISDPFNGDRYEVYDIDKVPLEYHHYPVDGVQKGKTIGLAFCIYMSDERYWDSKVFKVREFLDDVSNGYGIRLKFDRYSTNGFVYLNGEEVPHEYDNIYIKKIEFVNNIQISTHGALGYELTLECAPPYDYDPDKPLYPNFCGIVE